MTTDNPACARWLVGHYYKMPHGAKWAGCYAKVLADDGAVYTMSHTRYVRGGTRAFAFNVTHACLDNEASVAIAKATGRSSQ